MSQDLKLLFFFYCIETYLEETQAEDKTSCWDNSAERFMKFVR